MLEVRDEAALTAPSAGVQGWTSEAAFALYRQAFNDLLSVHRQHFDRGQLSRRLKVKTGGYPEDCSQSSHHATHCNG